MQQDLAKVLVNPAQIAARVSQLGAEITQTYRDADELTLIVIINGAIPFAADLMRTIEMPLRLDCMRVSSYKDETSPTQKPELIDKLRLNLRDRHVLLVDDIMDTGHTFVRVVHEVQRLRPASVRFCALLEKTGRREVDEKPDFVGFSIPDEFVVGYGLDFAERYRNLPMIGVLKPERQNPPNFT